MVLRIDPHVHCRDWTQSYKETVTHALRVAAANGLSAIFDMPNTDPPITTEAHVLKRLQLVPADSPVWYGLYIAATADLSQVKEAARLVAKHEHVVGIKMFAGHSTGNLGVTDLTTQRNVFETLAGTGYQGVLFIHCEKESLMKPSLWDPSVPYSHCLARPPEAEIESVKDMLRLAHESGFKGKLYLGHLSTPQAIDLANAAKKDLRVYSATTLHHLILHAELYKEKNGLLFKANPPLRPLAVVEELRKRVREGKVDCLETDHAPHSLDEKRSPPYMSGIPALPIYHKALVYLRDTLKIPAEILDRMTSTNIIKIFELEHLQLTETIPTLHNYRQDYAVDPYQGVL